MTAHTWKQHNPTRVVFGPGVVREVDRVAGDHVLLVCSPGAVERGLAGRVAALIGERRVRVHARVAANPAIDRLDESIDELAHASIDAVVALGGGSALDTGKVLSLSLANGGVHVRELLELASRSDEVPRVPLVAVPTTAGSGSEVTPFATVWSAIEPRKLSLGCTSAFPSVALVDPELAIGLNWEQTLSTGLDAFVQCFESIWNRNATPVASAVAERGLSLAPDALRRLKREPHALAARSDLAEAALLSGLAISQTRTALAHSLSYPITAQLGVPHGLACALVLPAVLEFNLEADDGRLAKLADRLGLAEPEALLGRVLELYRELGVGQVVRRYVDDLGRLEELAPEMLAPGRAELNLRQPDLEAVRGILSRTDELLGVEVTA